LQEERDECLNLEYLCGLLHEDVVILEAQAHQLSALQGRVRARHRNDLRNNSIFRHAYGTGFALKLTDPELVLPSSSFRIRSQTVHFISVADPRHFDADPDPVRHLDADPDPVFHFDADPDPAIHFHADPGSGPGAFLTPGSGIRKKKIQSQDLG
jgi:hypothetical protein